MVNVIVIFSLMLNFLEGTFRKDKSSVTNANKTVKVFKMRQISESKLEFMIYYQNIVV